MRIGHGYDVHRFEGNAARETRPLVLGGVEIEEAERGLAGHSDADVLLHAVADALLGAAALGDLGAHFPATDPEWAGADSMDLLGTVARRVADEGYAVENVDATVVLEAPKLRPHIEAMRRNAADALAVETGRVSVKATTSEKIGFAGREEGAAAHAVCLLSEA
jgi:2-C-methyl-D-erythritol 2,4-cyclodiphosphate synthase